MLAAPVLADTAPKPLEVVSVDKSHLPKVSMVVASPAELKGRDIPSSSWKVTQRGKPRKAKVDRLKSDQLEVVLTIDTTGSVFYGAALDAAKSAAANFVRQMPADVKIAVVGYASTSYVASPLSTDRAGTIAAIQNLPLSGGTALYDGLTTSARQFSGNTAAGRSVVLFSKGTDTASTANGDAAAKALSGAGVSFYAVLLPSTETDAPALQALAEATGGQQVVSVTDPSALDGVYKAIASSITNQYRLTFTAEGTGQTQVSMTVRDQGVAAGASRAIELSKQRPASQASVSKPYVVHAPAQGWMLALGLSAFFAAIVIAGLYAFAPRSRRLGEGRPVLQIRAPRTGRLTEITNRATQFAERSLERQGKQGALNAALEHAGIALRPGEFVVLAFTGTFVAFAIGVLLANMIVGLVLAAITAFAFRFAVRYLVERRRAMFADQLGDTLQLLSSSLRAGYGMLQAVDAVAREADSPTADEFQRLVVETRLGRSVPEALHAMADRVGNEDFNWVVQAIDINRDVGGDLTEVLDRVSNTIRERDHVRRQIRALSAEGRLSAIILFALPIFMFLFVRVVNPDYIGELTGSTVGKIMIAFAIFLLIMGGMWLRRIVRVVF
jgi:tight adherence protein B